MGKLTQLTLLSMLQTMIQDEDFLELLVDCIKKIFDIATPNLITNDSFEIALNRIMEYFETHTEIQKVEIPGIRNTFIGMLKEKQFLAFARVLRMFGNLLEYPDVRIINYLKQLKFLTGMKGGSISPWIDVRSTAEAVIEELNPQKMRIFAELSREEKCLLQGFTSEQIAIVSKFSPRGLVILSKLTHLTQNERSMILGLNEDERRLIKNLGFQNLRALSRTQFFGVKEGENTLQKLIGRETVVIRGMTEEAGTVAEGIHLLTVEEREKYLNLSPRELDTLKNMNEEFRNVVLSFRKLNEVLNVAKNLHSSQRDLVLSLRQGEIDALLGNAYLEDLQQIQGILRRRQMIIQKSCSLSVAEQDAILELNQRQRLVLAKAYELSHDGLFMIRQLGPELTRQVLIGKGELNVMQIALKKKLANVYFDGNILPELFEIMEHESQSILLNLSWKGMKLLRKTSHLDEKMIDIVRRLSDNGMKVLTNNDQLTGTEILMLGNLDRIEGNILMNLNLDQRHHLSDQPDFNQSPTGIFKPQQLRKLSTLSVQGKSVLERIVLLTDEEHLLWEGLRELDTDVLTVMFPQELNLLASLTPGKLDILSSFCFWRLGEDLTFQFFRIPLDVSYEDKISQTRGILRRIPRDGTGGDQHWYIPLIAGGIEILRLNGVVTDEYVRQIIPMVEGATVSFLFKLNLLKFSVRDSASLVPYLTSLLEGTEEDITIVRVFNLMETIEDLMFIRWILSSSSTMNTRGLFSIGRDCLIHQSYHLEDGRELGALLSATTSQLDGIDHKTLMENFKRMMRADRYTLATYLFFAIGRESNSDEAAKQVTRILIANFDADESFQFLYTPADDGFLRVIRDRGLPDILSDERFPNPTVFEVCLYHDRGNILALTERLDEDQLWKLLENRALVLLRMMTRNFRIDLIKCFGKVVKVKQVWERNHVEVFQSLMEELRQRGADLTPEKYSYIARGIRELTHWPSFLGPDTYMSMILEYIELVQGRVSRSTLRDILNSFVSKEVSREYLLRAVEQQFGEKLVISLRDRSGSCCVIGRRRRGAGVLCVDSENTRDLTSEAEARMSRLEKATATTGFVFTMFFVAKHIANGDVKGLGYDALNLLILPKIGEKIMEGLEKSHLVIGSVLGTTVSNFAAFLGLVDGIIARKNAVSEVDEEIADLNIVTNAEIIAANIPAIATRILGEFGVEMVVLGELGGPVGVALTVPLVVGSYLIGVGLEVEKVTNRIRLSFWEKVSLYWEILRDHSVPEKFVIDMLARDKYTKYIANHLRRLNGSYDEIGLSLPSFLITGKEDSMTSVMDFSRRVEALYPFSTRHQHSRIVPENIEGYDFVCGPSTRDAMEKVIPQSVSHTCLKELFIPSKPDDDCRNIISFRKQGFLNPLKTFFYLASDAQIELLGGHSLDIEFYGKKISITDGGIIGPYKPVNRYYFQYPLDECSIHKRGYNFFYVVGGSFECDLGEQHNTVVIRSDFSDSSGVHSIVGSEGRERIEANFAEFVDGSGGGDFIRATRNTVVKGYENDLVTGDCTVILPFNVSGIAELVAHTRITISNRNGSWIEVDGNARIVTADHYLLTPIRISNITHRMIRAHVRKTINHRISIAEELPVLRNLTIPNCKLVKQITSVNRDIVLSDSGQNVFTMDKNGQEYYWEAAQHPASLYIFGRKFAKVTISNGNGILDFRELGIDPVSNNLNHLWCPEGGIKITVGGLQVHLLPGYENIRLTFDGNKYFKLGELDMCRDWCSHILVIVGRVFIDGNDLHNYYNCFEFDSEMIFFYRLNEDLLLVSGEQVLAISKYYSHLHGGTELALKLRHGRIIEAPGFKERADHAHKVIYYEVGDSELQIYHNQPVDKHHIGYLDLPHRSIKDVEMRINCGRLLLLYRNSTLVRIENWDNYAPTRDMVFAFKDSFLPNVECIFSNCNPGDIIDEFKMEKRKRSATSSASRASSWINVVINPIRNYYATLFLPGPIPNRTPNEFSTDLCIMSNVNLVFVLLQGFLDRISPRPKLRNITTVETLGNVIDLIEEYPPRPNHDSFQLYSDIVELVRNGRYDSIRKMLNLNL